MVTSDIFALKNRYRAFIGDAFGVFDTHTYILKNNWKYVLENMYRNTCDWKNI